MVEHQKEKSLNFKIKCKVCGHEVMVARVKIEKNIKKIIRESEE